MPPPVTPSSSTPRSPDLEREAPPPAGGTPQPADPASPPVTEPGNEGFELGGSFATFGQFGTPPEALRLRFPGQAPDNDRLSFGARAVFVLTNTGPGTIRSVDAVIEGSSEHPLGDDAQRYRGWANVGLNTDHWRFTLSGAHEPSVELPAMVKLSVSRRPFSLTALGNTQLDWGLRLSYLYDTSSQSYRSGTGGEPVPPHILAPGGFIRLTTNREWKLGNDTALNFAADHELGLDAPFRIVEGAYAEELISGTGTSLDLSTLVGLGGIYDRGHMNLSLDLGRGHTNIEPMIYADHALHWGDVTVAPRWAANTGGGVRLTTKNLTASAGVHAHMQPTLDRNFAASPEAFGTIDLNLLDDGRLRLSGMARYRAAAEGPSWGARGALQWLAHPNLLLSAGGGHDTHSGTTAFLQVAVPFGGRHKEPHIAARTPNPLQVNLPPARARIDARGADRRNKLHRVEGPEVPFESLPPPIQRLVSRAPPQKQTLSFLEVLQAIPRDQPQLLIDFLDTPEKVSAALDFHIDYPARAAWPGEAPISKPTYRDMHEWARRVLEHHGIDATIATVTVHDRPQSVLLFRDPASPGAEVLKRPLPEVTTLQRDIRAGRWDQALVHIDALSARALSAPTLSQHEKIGLAIALRDMTKAAEEADDIHIAWKLLLGLLGLVPLLVYWLVDAVSDNDIERASAAMERLQRRLGATEVEQRGPRWHAMNNRAIARTDARNPREALERYCSGRGDGVSPGFMVQPPAAFEWGPDDARMRAMHDTITSDESSDFSALGDLTGVSYAELKARVSALAATDPDAAQRAIRALIGDNGPIDYQFHTDEPSKFSPEETWSKRYGVCAEYHILAADLLRAAGYEAYPVEIFGGGLAHVVCVQRSGDGWVVHDYSTQKKTNPPARTIEEAIAAYEPGYDEFSVLEPKGGLPAVRKVVISMQAQIAREFMQRRQ